MDIYSLKIRELVIIKINLFPLYVNTFFDIFNNYMVIICHYIFYLYI